MTTPKTLAVLISGRGSNLAALIAAVEDGRLPARIVLVLADRDCAGLEHALNAGIPVQLIDRKLPDFGARLTAALPPVDFIVLAGFLSIIPPALIRRFPQKIINLHPSLLPKFGGPGMYGLRVHAAVLAAGETESGCSVHWVDEGVDTGAVIAQARVPVQAGDSPESLAARVQAEEHELLIRTLGRLLDGPPIAVL